MEIEMEKFEMYKQEQLDIIHNSKSLETDDGPKKINDEDFSKITEYLDNYIKKRTFEIDNMIEKQREEREKELDKHFEEKMKQKNEEIESIIDEKMKSANLNNLQIPFTNEQNIILENIISSNRAKYEQHFLEEKKKLDELLDMDNEAVLYKKKQEIYIDKLLLQKQYELEEYKKKRKIEIDNEYEQIKNNIISVDVSNNVNTAAVVLPFQYWVEWIKSSTTGYWIGTKNVAPNIAQMC
jgi:hypothetical protein